MVPKYKTSVHRHRKDVIKNGENGKPWKDILTHKGRVPALQQSSACRAEAFVNSRLEWDCSLNSVSEISAVYHKSIQCHQVSDDRCWLFLHLCSTIYHSLALLSLLLCLGWDQLYSLHGNKNTSYIFTLKFFLSIYEVRGYL